MQELKTTIKELRKALNEVIIEAEKQKMSTNIVEICSFYKTIYEEFSLLDELNTLLKGVKTEFAKDIIPKLFEANQVDSIVTANRQFILNSEFHASIPADNQPEAFKWLMDNDYGMLIKAGVNSQSLSSAMKEYVKDKGELPPKEIMNIHIGSKISMRKK